MAKEKNRFWIKLLVPLGILLVTFAVGYGTLNQKVNHNTATGEKNDTAVDSIKEDVLIIMGDVKVINVKQDVMQKSLDRIEKKL